MRISYGHGIEDGVAEPHTLQCKKLMGYIATHRCFVFASETSKLYIRYVCINQIQIFLAIVDIPEILVGIKLVVKSKTVIAIDIGEF